MPYRPTRFNHTVGVDLKFVHDYDHNQYVFLSVLDYATTFNVGVLVPDKSEQSVGKALQEYWLRWAGPPDHLVYDKGTEYQGVFRNIVDKFGLFTKVIPNEASWQHGMTERHGGVLVDIIESVVAELQLKGPEAMSEALIHSSAAKNRRPGRTGFSPRAMVFGCDERLPGSLLSHRLEQPDVVSAAFGSVDAQYTRSLQIRESAMKAVVALDHSEKWKAALQHRGRPTLKTYFPGEWVYYWQRQGTRANIKGRMRRDAYRWHGPAIIIGREWDHRGETHSYWVSHGGMLKLVVQEHLRAMSDPAAQDLDKLHKELGLARSAVRPDGSPLDYEDLTQQRGPTEGEATAPMFGLPAPKKRARRAPAAATPAQPSVAPPAPPSVTAPSFPHTPRSLPGTTAPSQSSMPFVGTAPTVCEAAPSAPPLSQEQDQPTSQGAAACIA
jgi:hypothetical protein